MRLFATLLIICVSFLQGCTLLGLASTTASVTSAKHGWFDVNTKLVNKSDLQRPSVPLNLSLHMRVIVQGFDTNKKGTMEDSFEWLFANEARKEMVELLEKNGFALITDRGLDGAVYIEISDTMENFGMRYLPFLPTVRWTERKIGKMRITFINASNRKVSSTLKEESIYIQSGILSDSPHAEYKQKPFDLSRWDYTIKGDTVGLSELNEQLFYQCMEKIQDKVSLDEFFGVPDHSLNEPNAPDPEEGWHNNTGGEIIEESNT